jgi:predicted transcriptional regulator
MAEEKPRDVTREELLRYSTEIVASYLGKNKVPSEQIGEVINTVFNSLASLDQDGAEEPAPKGGARPAVPIRRSVTPEFIICLEDGKKLKMLKRYLRTNYKMTPEEYRAKWGLPPDYPMVAPNYAKQRSDFAKTIGLGRDATRKRGRKRPS